jgi:hypothetical protein
MSRLLPGLTLSSLKKHYDVCVVVLSHSGIIIKNVIDLKVEIRVVATIRISLQSHITRVEACQLFLEEKTRLIT